MGFHPHLNRNSNRLHKFHNKIIRDNKKSKHDSTPLLTKNPKPISRPNLNTTIKRQHSSVPPYQPTLGKTLNSRNEQNVDFDSKCIIL